MILRESVLGGTAQSSPTTSHRGVAQLVARMLWEHDVGCSSHLTPTSFIGKTACLGGFSAFLVLFLCSRRLLFSGGFRGRKAAGARASVVAEAAKSLTHP